MSDSGKSKGYIREAIVIFAVVLGCYFYLSLSTFTPAEQDGNMGGNVGYWLAYGSLFMFGNSAYLIVAIFIYSLWLYASVLQQDKSQRPSILSSLIGLILLIIATCGLEALRVYSDNTNLPNERSGGIIGFGVAKSLFDALGFQGATLILIGAWFSSLSLFAMFSWLALSDKLGSLFGYLWQQLAKFTSEIAKQRAEAKAAAPKIAPKPPRATVAKRAAEPELPPSDRKSVV